MAETPERATRTCCFPFQDLLLGCLEVLRRPASAEVIARRRTCLCGQRIVEFGCGHSFHDRELPPPPQSCLICLSGGWQRERGRPPSPVYSSAAAIGEENPLVLLPPPLCRFVHARAEQGQDKASSSSSVQDSGVQERSPSPPLPLSTFVHFQAEQSQDQPPS
ncbi:hypothetical protein ABZP36_004265 [Zizania latifolia]